MILINNKHGSCDNLSIPWQRKKGFKFSMDVSGLINVYYLIFFITFYIELDNSNCSLSILFCCFVIVIFNYFVDFLCKMLFVYRRHYCYDLCILVLAVKYNGNIFQCLHGSKHFVYFTITWMIKLIYLVCHDKNIIIYKETIKQLHNNSWGDISAIQRWVVVMKKCV